MISKNGLKDKPAQTDETLTRNQNINPELKHKITVVLKRF
jgi:hypothetical protein